MLVAITMIAYSNSSNVCICHGSKGGFCTASVYLQIYNRYKTVHITSFLYLIPYCWLCDIHIYCL